MKFILRFIVFSMLVIFWDVTASAQNRMTDRQPNQQVAQSDEIPFDEEDDSPAQADSPKPSFSNINNAQPKSSARDPVINTPQPRTGNTMDRKAMENLGPLTNPIKGGLGEDMWSGSTRSVVQDFLPKLPTGNTLGAIQLLTRRILLSNGDVSLMKNDRSAGPGQDLFTLRLEKLLEMGAYSDAVDLYTLIEGEPSHDRLAQAGIMALMFDGYPAQACLEVRAAHKDKAETSDSDAFWPQIEAVCLFIQAQSIKTLKDPALTSISPVTGIPGSKILTTLVSRADYRHTVATPSDIADLTDMERAVLKGLGRFDYTRLKLKKLNEISSPVLMIMAGDPNMPTAMRLDLNYEAAERGLIDASGLAALYSNIVKQTEAPNTEPSSTIQGRYVAALKTEGERKSIISALLDSYQGNWPTPLLPFANWVSAINPAGLSPKAVRTGLVLMLQDGMTPPMRWVTSWLKGQSGDSRKSAENLALYLANLVPENLPTESVGFPDDDVKKAFMPLESAESLKIYAVFAGLGRANSLHNYIPQDIYEKDIDLTHRNDYVMPIDSLIDKLREAAKNDRLGETVLLAAVALNQYDPAKTHPGVLQEVLKSLETVGLKEEARAVAVEVILSLKQ